MTTDVINGVPRELLRDAMRMLEAHSPGSGSVESYAAQDIQALLATAQPADHSEHALNMVSQPAADGEREVWAVPVLDGEKKTTFYTEQLPFVPGIGVKQLGEPVRMVEARAAQPAADGEREAFEAYCQTIGYTLKTGDSGHYLGGYGAEIWAGWKARADQPQQTVAVTDVSTLKIALAELHKCGVKPGSLPHMVLTNLIDAAHKTGEEE